MRRKPTAPHESHERWLVSYADFITLLFAFFVVMFASTQADKEKARQVSEAVREALEHGQFSSAISTMLGRGKHEASRPPLNTERVNRSENLPPSPAAAAAAKGPAQPHPADLGKSLEALQRGLAAELVAGKLDLKLERRGLVISLRESAFFASGDDAIAAASLPTVSKIAAEIQKLPNPLRLEGHTDSVPIHNSRFRSNWELSTARAIAMLELLRQQFLVTPQRMSVAGYAENAPADTNDTPEGRAHNRRVDLVVLSAEAELNEPQKSGVRSQESESPSAAPRF